MGNEKNTEVIEEMEDILGLKEESTEGDTSKEDVKSEETSEKKDETPETETTPKTETTLVTPEQININKELTKIDLQLESLEKESVDVSLFYDSLEEHLTEEEQALEFDDKPAYMKLVAAKAKEYETTHSKSEDITKLQEEKAELEKVYERQSAIVEVSAEFPEYDHEKVLAFYENDLSKSEQNKIIEESASYKDVYVNTFKKLQEKNPKNISKSETPNIPNVNGVRKSPATNQETDDGLSSEDEQLREALGL